MTRESALRVAAPLLFGAAALALWQLVVVVQHVPSYVLPSPSAISAAALDDAGDVTSAALATGSNALVGLVGGSVLGVLAAMLAARTRLLDDLMSPVAAAVSALPIVAVAPLLNTMFSVTSSVPRRLVVAIVVFFPMFVNTLRGLRQVDPTHAALLQSYAASPWDLTRTVRLPGSVPFLCTGLRVASSTAVIAAVVAEYFGGLQDGLGSRITSAASNTAYARAWAYVIGAVVLGLLFYLAALLVERVVSPMPRTWKEPL